jgi:hypothetical protein
VIFVQVNSELVEFGELLLRSIQQMTPAERVQARENLNSKTAEWKTCKMEIPMNSAKSQLIRLTLDSLMQEPRQPVEDENRAVSPSVQKPEADVSILTLRYLWPNGTTIRFALYELATPAAQIVLRLFNSLYGQAVIVQSTDSAKNALN